MATNFPTSLDSYSDLTCGSSDNPKDRVNNLQDAVEVIEAKIGINSSAVTTSHDYILSQTPGSTPVANKAWRPDSNKNLDLGVGSLTATGVTATTGTITNVVSTTVVSGTSVDTPTTTTNTINEKTADNGVLIEAVLIKDSYIRLSELSSSPTATADKIHFYARNNGGKPALYLADQDANDKPFGYWISYTPAWTATSVNPAIGDGTITGSYTYLGRTVIGNVLITAGASTTFGTGSYRISLPIASAAATDTCMGAVSLLDNGTAYHEGVLRQVSSTTVELIIGSSQVGPTAPFTFVSGDKISINFSYNTSV